MDTTNDGWGWEQTEAQLDYWAEMDRKYWEQRKEQEYKAWFERTYGVKPSGLREFVGL